MDYPPMNNDCCARRTERQAVVFQAPPLVRKSFSPRTEGLSNYTQVTIQHYAAAQEIRSPALWIREAKVLESHDVTWSRIFDLLRFGHWILRPIQINAAQVTSFCGQCHGSLFRLVADSRVTGGIDL